MKFEVAWKWNENYEMWKNQDEMWRTDTIVSASGPEQVAQKIANGETDIVDKDSRHLGQITVRVKQIVEEEYFEFVPPARATQIKKVDNPGEFREV